MEKLKSDGMHIPSLKKVKANAQGHQHSSGSNDYHHQRVSVNDIIRNHYRKGK